MTFNVQGSFFGDLLTAQINIGTDTFRLILLSSSYSWNWSHNRRDDLTGELAAGGGYTTGGLAITLSSAVDAIAQTAILTLSGVSISPGPITGARWGAVVKWGGGAASSDPLLGVFDWGRTLPAGPLIIPSASITHYR